MENIIATTTNAYAMSKLLALQIALADCGITSVITNVDEEGSVCLSAPLWNCVDGSGERLEVYALSVEDFEIGHAVDPAGCDYDELLEDYDLSAEEAEEE